MAASAPAALGEGIVTMRFAIPRRPSRFRAMAMMTIAGNLLAVPISAQTIGDRVRVTVTGEMMIGEVTGVSLEGFDIDIEDAGSASVVRSEIERLERSTGIESHWKRGLLIGGIGGLTAGLLAGSEFGDCQRERTLEDVLLGSPGDGCVQTAEEIGWTWGFVGAGLGGILGLGVGALIKKQESWLTIPNRAAGSTFRPAIDVRLGRDGRIAAVLGGRIQF